MRNTLKNTSLKADLKTILKTLDNIKEIRKGSVSGYSIEIEYTEPTSVASYIYYETKAKRDADFKEIKKQVKVFVNPTSKGAYITFEPNADLNGNSKEFKTKTV